MLTVAIFGGSFNPPHLSHETIVATILERAGVIAAVVPITRLKDWLDVRARLAGVAVVRRAEMVLLSRSEVRVNLHFIGDRDQLALALEQSDLRLFEEGGQWRLGLTGAAAKGKS